MNFPLKADYKPDEWRAEYAQKLRVDVVSLEKFADMATGTGHDTEEKLLDILVWATLVERALQFNGQQTAQELLDNIQVIAQESGNFSPFPSLIELEPFLASLDGLFLKNPRTKKYQNSGAGFRKLIQFFYQRLAGLQPGGNAVTIKNLENVMNKFGDALQRNEDLDSTESHIRLDFQKKEAFLDFSSFKMLAMQVEGFDYDPERGRLTLQRSADKRLSLVLPILCELRYTGALDISRKATGEAKVLSEMYGILSALIISGPLVGFRVNHRTKLGVLADKKVQLGDKIFFEGALYPDNTRGQVQLYKFVNQCLTMSELSGGGISSSEAGGFKAKEEKVVALMNNRFELNPRHLFKDSRNLNN